jgi:hypothetical protein
MYIHIEKIYNRHDYTVFAPTQQQIFGNLVNYRRLFICVAKASSCNFPHSFRRWFNLSSKLTAEKPHPVHEENKPSSGNVSNQLFTIFCGLNSMGTKKTVL